MTTFATARDVRRDVRQRDSACTLRCAIYTRKSTEEGLNQEFNTLDAQRDAALAYIASQKSAGWVALPERYDDGGYSGGSTDRPALKRLLADIEAGKINVVVTYKLDRLSRSLLDFATLMATFEKHGVAFVSITQQFASNTSMGKLTLHILMSFAQFEREVIAERTRDKIAATRKRGIYTVGKPILGYDLVAAPPPFTGKRMAVNEREAEIVRAIFAAYLEHRSLLKVVKLCEQRGWRTKSWTASSGRVMGGQPFAKPEVSRLLRNVLYVGKVAHHQHVYDGEHDAVVDADTFAAVQQQLKIASQAGGSGQTTHANPLRGLVRCKACGCSMTMSTVTRKGKKSSTTHRYFVCSNASKRGRAACPSPSLPAKDLEDFVLAQLKPLLTEDATLAAVVEQARQQLADAAQRRVEELATLREQLAGQAGFVGKDVARERERLKRQVKALEARIAADEARQIDEDEIVGAVESFDTLWDAMLPGEREQLMRTLVEKVEYDASSETVSVTCRAGVGFNQSEA
ncbi:MAG TPA: recombinase family protein [Phycisphaerales bacterium]|nr:recombinase family protein [Phycisphaerales bacterium]